MAEPAPAMGDGGAARLIEKAGVAMSGRALIAAGFSPEAECHRPDDPIVAITSHADFARRRYIPKRWLGRAAGRKDAP